MHSPRSIAIKSIHMCLVGIALVSACTPDFEEPWEVLDLRVLAIKAEPPELIFTEIPEQIPPVRIDALIVDPRDPGRNITWEAWACTPDDTRCEQATLSEPVVASKTSRLNEVSFEFVPSVALAFASLETDPFRGFGGLPIFIELRIQDGEFTVIAIKRVVYTFPLPYSPLPPDKQANANPTIEQLSLDDIDPPADGSAIDIGQEVEVKVVPVPTTDAKESYWVTTSAGLTAGQQAPDFGTGFAQRDEFLSYAFFSSSGKFSSGTTGGPPSPFIERKKVDDISSTWTSPAEQGETTMWVVIRDGRGGANWSQRTWNVQ